MSHKTVCLTFAMVLSSLGRPAHAGEIHLVSDLWPMICRVEVVEGIDAVQPSSQIHEITRVAPGTVYIGRDRLCYRRSAVPDDCYSDLNAWTCFTYLGDKVERLSLF